MTSFRTIALLSAVIGVTNAITCYSGTTSNNERPSKTQECNSQFCTQIVMTVKGNTATVYGCDQTELCKNEGCFSSYGDSQVCCCGKDQCNSSSKLSALFALLPVVFLKLF
ncbi:hypothetical protein Y032_0168g164 [Ancylostoma ceylanicum]|nr:hypothetical protein Y032_0168g164 [Ancylostoma ceylanicum]